MSRREEITAEKARLLNIAKGIYEAAKRDQREFTDAEHTEFHEAIEICNEIQAELDATAEIIPLVRLDSRLTRERTIPVGKRICLEAIDELENELAACFDEPRRQGIEIERQSWRAELAAAKRYEEAILSQSHSRRLATV